MDTFDVIFTTYSPLVFRYLRSLCGDAAVAEELTAETFYRAYTHFDSFRGDSKLETWLCAIAKNAYLKDCRRSARTVGADALVTQPAETDFVERFLDRIVVVSHAVTHSAVILDIEHLGFRRGPAPVRNIRTGGRRLAFRSTASRKSAQQHYRSEQHT